MTRPLPNQYQFHVLYDARYGFTTEITEPKQAIRFMRHVVLKMTQEQMGLDTLRPLCVEQLRPTTAKQYICSLENYGWCPDLNYGCEVREYLNKLCQRYLKVSASQVFPLVFDNSIETRLAVSKMREKAEKDRQAKLLKKHKEEAAALRQIEKGKEAETRALRALEKARSLIKAGRERQQKLLQGVGT